MPVLAQSAVGKHFRCIFGLKSFDDGIHIEALAVAVGKIPHLRLFRFKLIASGEEVALPGLMSTVGIAVSYANDFPRAPPVNLDYPAEEDRFIIGMCYNEKIILFQMQALPLIRF